MYLELHARSAFSFLEGGSLPEALTARAAELGRAGVEHAREFAWPRVAERVERVLVEVSKSRP